MKKNFLTLTLSTSGCFLDEETGACEVSYGACWNDFTTDICTDQGGGGRLS